MNFIKKIGSMFEDKSGKMQKNDWIILAVIILIYSVISFINLGSFKNPQTFEIFNEETIATIELEETQKVSKIRHYSGEQAGEYKVLRFS